MASQDYYKNMDIKYLEIGIALTRIDRMYPGLVPFSIPVLTPDLQKETQQTSTVIQRDKSNIMNEDKDAVDVSDLEITNAILIEIPVELCALPGAYHNIGGSFTSYHDLDTDGSIVIQGAMSMTGRSRIDGRLKFNGNINGWTRYYGVRGASFIGPGAITGSTSIDTSGTITGRVVKHYTRGYDDVRDIHGDVSLPLGGKSRYIEPNSRWLITFIGGDIAAPAVVCRLPMSAGIPVTEESIQEKQAKEYPEINNNEYDVTYPYPDQNNFDEAYAERTPQQAPSIVTMPSGTKDEREHITDFSNLTAIADSYSVYTPDTSNTGFENDTDTPDSPEDDYEFTVLNDTFNFDLEKIEIKPGETCTLYDDRIKDTYSGTFVPIPALADICKGALVEVKNGYCNVRLVSSNKYPIIGTVQIHGSDQTYLVL